jgi:hypothetical protein
MVMGCISIQMENGILENGNKMKNVGKERSIIMMALFLQVPNKPLFLMNIGTFKNN